MGYANVVQAPDGNAAWSTLKGDDAFDLLICDFDIPGMTGVDLLKRVRADAQLAKMPVLMLTAEAKREQIVEAMQAGVNGYMIKPFTPKTLEDKIAKILAA